MLAKLMRFIRYCFTQRISKLQRNLEIRWVRQYLLNVLPVLKVLQTYEMTVQLKRNLFVGPVNIFPNFCHYLGWALTICLLPKYPLITWHLNEINLLIPRPVRLRMTPIVLTYPVWGHKSCHSVIFDIVSVTSRAARGTPVQLLDHLPK